MLMSIGPDLFKFLRELKENNNRDWFQANKGRYDTDVKQPMFDFIEAFGDRLPAISPPGMFMLRVFTCI
jgi:uncharacterized protein (DUF2461 family)